MYIDPQNLFTAGEAIEITSEGTKPKINVLYDGVTIVLDKEKNQIKVIPDTKRALDVDSEGLHVVVDDKTIIIDDGKLVAIPEPLKDGVATHVHFGTERWDSESIDLVHDKLSGLDVNDNNELYIKLNSEQALEFNDEGQIQVKIVPEEGLDFKPDGKLFIKLVESEGLEFKDGEIVVKLSNDEALEFNSEGKIKVKVDDSTVHISDDGNVELHLDTESGIDVDSEGNLFVRIDKSTIHYNSETGELELHPDEDRAFAVDNDGKLFIKVDNESVVINSEGELTSALNVNEALEMIDCEGHPVVNVLYDHNTIYLNSENELELRLHPHKGLFVDSDGLLSVFPDTSRVRDKALMYDTEGNLIWGDAGKVDKIILYDQVHEPDSKIVTLPLATDSEYGIIKIDNKTLKEFPEHTSPEGYHIAVNIDDNTIIYDDSEDKVKVNFDTVQKKLEPIDALRIDESEGWVTDRITVLYDALLGDSEPSIDIRNNHLYATDVLLNGPGSAKGTLKDIVPAAAGTRRTSDPNKINDLVDYNTLWDAISASLGEFRGTYGSDSELERAWPYGAPDKNDYAYVTRITSEATYYERYKCVDSSEGSEGNWKFEFRIANSTFTSPQWQAIMSTITEEDVDDLLNHVRNTNNPHNVTAAQLDLAPFKGKTFDNTPTDGSTNAVTSDGIYDALQKRQLRLKSGNSILMETSEDALGEFVWISAETNLYQAGPGVTISSEGVISSIAAVPGFGDITGQPDDNPELAALFDDLYTNKQNVLTAGPGINIAGDVVSNTHVAGAGLGLNNNVFSVVTPIKGGTGVNVEGTWGDSEGIRINISNIGNSVTGDPTKIVTGQAISDYAEENFKKIQTPVADVTASGSTTEFISSVTQDAQGKITVTKKAIDLSGLNVGAGNISISVAGGAAQTFNVNQATNSTLNFPISYNNLQDKPTIPVVPTVGNGQLTIANSDGSRTYGTFTANQTGNTVVNIPTGTVVDIERW